MGTTNHCLPWCDDHDDKYGDACQHAVILIDLEEQDAVQPSMHEETGRHSALAGLGQISFGPVLDGDSLFLKATYDHEAAQDAAENPEGGTQAAWIDLDIWRLQDKERDEPLGRLELNLNDVKEIHQELGAFIEAIESGGGFQD